MPNIEDDAVPMANLIKSRQPNILTVALDPEGTGPDTHYKVLLVLPLLSLPLSSRGSSYRNRLLLLVYVSLCPILISTLTVSSGDIAMFGLSLRLLMPPS